MTNTICNAPHQRFLQTLALPVLANHSLYGGTTNTLLNKTRVSPKKKTSVLRQQNYHYLLKMKIKTKHPTTTKLNLSKVGFIGSKAMPSFNIPTFDSSAHIKREDPHRVMKGNVWTQQQNITPHSLWTVMPVPAAMENTHSRSLFPQVQEKQKGLVMQLRHFT